jgi:hypothetical protein
MHVRRLIIPALALWGIIALAAFDSCSRRGATTTEHVPDDGGQADGAPDATLAYWDRLREAYVRHSRATIRRDELERKANEIRSLKDGGRVWGELATSYRHSAESAVEAARAIRALPNDGVDQSAIKLAGDIERYLLVRNDLLLLSGQQCSEMATLFDAIVAEGEGFNWDSTGGKEYAKRQESIQAKMRQTVNDQGRKEKAMLSELEASCNRAKVLLERRYGRNFRHIMPGD